MVRRRVHYRIPSLGGDSHLAHAFACVGEVADVETHGWVMMIAQLNRCGVEMEILGRKCLLPCLQRGHGVVAELVGEAADRIGGVIECE